MVLKNQLYFPFSMPPLAVTQSQHFTEKARSAWNAWALYGEFTDVFAVMIRHKKVVHLMHSCDCRPKDLFRKFSRL